MIVITHEFICDGYNCGKKIQVKHVINDTKCVMPKPCLPDDWFEADGSIYCNEHELKIVDKI